MAKHTSFRESKVRADSRSKIWYLTYFEDGQRRRQSDCAMLGNLR